MDASGLCDQTNTLPNAVDNLTFPFDCLPMLGDLNMELTINQTIRIGINNGGPILACVLGTDNRVSDIIVDTIDFAARLRGTSFEDMIQLSE
jgi:hypothetical protein